ncbi:uncharacterized protein LOC128210960 [Mya arenaria]|uniref:uncharacterized protein LOC128210960 n=1 Tax=Mya arenaria TaxID=6604 RepID=UPI0022E704C7|nr:uncharacterized protein LOC128210960 [Mya arenaria]
MLMSLIRRFKYHNTANQKKQQQTSEQADKAATSGSNYKGHQDGARFHDARFRGAGPESEEGSRTPSWFECASTAGTFQCRVKKFVVAGRPIFLKLLTLTSLF